MIVKLKNVRLSYPKLWTAEKFDANAKDGTERYSASFLIPKDDPQVKEINAALIAVVKERFKDNAKGMYDSFKANPQKFCLADGDVARNKKGELIAPGHYVLSSHRRKQDGAPAVFDRDCKTPLKEENGKPYAGCYVHAVVDIYAQDGQYSGIRCGLKGVVFYKDGDAFGGSRPATPEDFASLAEETSAADEKSFDDFDGD